MTIKKFIQDNFDIDREKINGFQCVIFKPKTEIGEFIYNYRGDKTEPLNIWWQRIDDEISLLNIDSLVDFILKFTNISKDEMYEEMDRIFFSYYLRH
jgi:hypothetical protein